MAKTVELKLTEAELGYIMDLIYDNIQNGDYWGNKEQFMKRQSTLCDKITRINDELILRKVRSANGME